MPPNRSCRTKITASDYVDRKAGPGEKSGIRAQMGPKSSASRILANFWPNKVYTSPKSGGAGGKWTLGRFASSDIAGRPRTSAPRPKPFMILRPVSNSSILRGITRPWRGASRCCRRSKSAAFSASSRSRGVRASGFLPFVGQDLLVEFQLLDQPLYLLDANIPAYDEPEARILR